MKKSLLESHIYIDILDENKKVIYQHKQKGESVVSNFLQMLYTRLSNVTIGSPDWNTSAPFPNNYQIKRTTGVYQTLASSVNVFDCNAPSANSNYGIILGIGTQAISPAVFNMDSSITHGVGANQLLYNQMQSPLGCHVVGSDTLLELNRTFVNNSGASIFVSEIGLISDLDGALALWYYDLVTPNLEIPNLLTAIASIQFSITT